jgi:hypothetical protein
MKMHLLILSALALLMLFVDRSCASFGTSTALEAIPNPNANPEKCGRASGIISKSAICDSDRKVSNKDLDVLEGFINAVTRAQIGVAVIERMASSNKDIDREAERYATSLHNTWGVGDAAKQNGVLIFLSIQDRAVYISTGSGVQDKLSGATVQSLIKMMKPYLRKQEYGTALQNCVVSSSRYL